MEDYAYPGMLSAIALLVYYYTLFKSGMARVRFNVPAPSHEGPEAYILWAAGIGLLWPVGRIWYAIGYYQAAEKRSLGLYLSMPPIYIFVVGSLIGFALQVVG